MACVYILQSSSSGRFYVGSTSNLQRRLEEHARRHSPATRFGGPWRLVYSESHPSLLEARRREHEIKAWKSARLIRRLVSSHG